MLTYADVRYMHASQVWKSVVQSQLRTLKAILPVLMETLIRELSNPSEEKKYVAGKAMGEMVSNLRHRVLTYADVC